MPVTARTTRQPIEVTPNRNDQWFGTARRRRLSILSMSAFRARSDVAIDPVDLGRVALLVGDIGDTTAHDGATGMLGRDHSNTSPPESAVASAA